MPKHNLLITESECVCMCVCAGLTLLTQPYGQQRSPASPSAESQEQPTQVAHLEYKHTKTCYFNWPSSHQAVNDLSSVLFVVFLLLFLRGRLHGNEHLVQNRWEWEGWKWYARAFSLAVFLVYVRQPAAFMEMDRAEGGSVAAATCSPLKKLPTEGIWRELWQI